MLVDFDYILYFVTDYVIFNSLLEDSVYKSHSF